MEDLRPGALRTAVPLIGALCATAGAIDAIAYLLFGQIFIANMTGNTVLFAVSVVRHDWHQAILRISVVIFFLLGIFAARAGLHKLAFTHKQRTRLLALAFEFFLLVILVLTSQPYTLRAGLLILLAFAMGVQNDAFRNIGGIRLNTSFITGDLQDLGAALANSEDPVKKDQARRRVAVFLTTWVAYGLGALLGGLCALHFDKNALWVPAALVIAAATIVLASPASQNQELPESEPSHPASA